MKFEIEYPNLPATSKQLWILHLLTHKDTRTWDLTVKEASDKISTLMTEKQNTPKVDFAGIYSKAIEAGKKALNECQPTPMVVQQHTNMLDDNSPVKKEWFVEGGVCGFAWINIKPGTSAFAKWLREKGYADKSYYGGVDIWIRDGGQSMERKEAYAAAVAKVLNENGIEAHMMSRMD